MKNHIVFLILINSNRYLLIQFHKNVFLQYLKFSLVSNNVTSLNKIYAL